MECLRCGNPLLESDVECIRCGEKTANYEAPPSTTTQKVTNMMGKGKPVTTVVPKVHIESVQYSPTSSTSDGVAAPLHASSVQVSASLTGAMIIGMIASVILFIAVFCPVVGIKISIPGMGNMYDQSYSLMKISNFLSTTDPMMNMLGTSQMKNGMAFFFLRHGASIVIVIAIFSFVLSFIRAYAGLAICGITTLLLGGYGIFGFYRVVAFFNEQANKNNDPSSGAPMIFNPSSLLDMVHLQFGIWIIMLAGVLLIVAAFFPRAD